MEGFEVLIILIFVVVSILEGVMRQRRSKGEPEAKPAPQPRRRESVGAGAARQSGGGVVTSDEGPAADMVPADLWEVLTGERRPTVPPPPEPAWEREAWLEEETPLDEVESPLERDEIEAPWESHDWDISRSEGEVTGPTSLEYVGPEAVSLETPPPPPEVRHRLYHMKYDTAPALPAPQRSGVSRELRAGLEGAGLRRSILLAEILGPPKGLI